MILGCSFIYSTPVGLEGDDIPKFRIHMENTELRKSNSSKIVLEFRDHLCKLKTCSWYWYEEHLLIDEMRWDEKMSKQETSVFWVNAGRLQDYNILGWMDGLGGIQSIQYKAL